MSYNTTKEGRAYCSWYEGKGKDRRKVTEYFGFGDIALEQARRLDEQKKTEKGKIKVEGGPTVSQVCAQYVIQHHVEPSTASSNDYRLRMSILPVLGDIPVDALTSEHLNNFILNRMADGLKKRSIDRELDILKAAFNWAISQDPPMIYRNPVGKIRITCNDEQVPFPPNTEELSRIIKVSPPHLARAIILNYHLMCRPGGEIARITWTDVDLVRNKIRVVSARKGGPSVRMIPITPELKAALERWKQQDIAALKKTRKKDKPEIYNLQVIHRRFKPVLSLKRSWSEAKAKAKITRKLRLYDLRHAGITQALEEGADLKATSEMAGHSRVDTTARIYQHVTKKQHRDAMEKIEPILNYSQLEYGAAVKVVKPKR